VVAARARCADKRARVIKPDAELGELGLRSCRLGVTVSAAGARIGTAARQLLRVSAGDDHPVDSVFPAGMAAAGCSPGHCRWQLGETEPFSSIGA
jgi:hypothetical protein